MGEQFIFYFSSKFHLEIFNRKREANFKLINEKFFNRFKTNIQCHTLPDFLLYEKVETRGYYVTDRDKNEISLNELMLIGVMVRRNPVGQNSLEKG